MDLYQCKVRLGGSRYNEITKVKVTVPEIFLLRYVHGLVDADTGEVDDSVVTDIKRIGRTDRSESDERARLQGVYGVALKRQGKSIDLMFGVGQPLPTTAEGVGAGPSAKLEPGEKPKRKYTRKAKDEDSETSEAEEADEIQDLVG
ncbi:hypothetical protein [Methyloceanibacter caenitepidi]|uniref:Uncharacterized protein n=1 Tax=Methyloceanibacter caenitepidi TaxID=1384459 RepID=A0A0A8JZ68_9HYPH|nr:hypothetical protein [Methyloceanibacter caenitepidi]BAQ16103.1 hypothetical protein GL4_0640 [Methyloceanibacter caenitepidi]